MWVEVPPHILLLDSLDVDLGTEGENTEPNFECWGLGDRI